MSNIVDAYPREGVVFRTKPLFQWDWGQIVRLHINDLPATYKVEFSNSTRADAVSTVQTTADVTIPAQFLESGNPVCAWVVVVDEARTTEYALIIPVSARAKPTDIEPSPEEQSEIEQTLSALNGAVSDVQEIADAIPETINAALEAAKESGEFDGPPGEPGPAGADGQPGPAGRDGVSPTASVTQTEDGAVLTVTDGSGTTTATLANGADGSPGRDGVDGLPGADGVSPSVAVTEITGGHRVSVTDADGTQVFDVMDGERGPQGETGPAGSPGAAGKDGSPGAAGADGFSPVASVSKSGTTTTISITDKNGTTTATVSDGAAGAKGDPGDDYVLTAQDKQDIAGMVDAPVTDVQVNGTSVLSNGVANVPLADNSTPGVAKVSSTRGVSMNSDFLTITPATEAIIKAGTDWYKPLGVRDLKASIFYGLSKLAGVDLASGSDTVGVYPDAAKVAIQKMLGVYQAPYRLIKEITITENTLVVVVNTDTNGDPISLSDVIVYAQNIVGTGSSNCLVYVNGDNYLGKLVTIVNLFSTSAKTGVAWLRTDGGRFFAESAAGFTNTYGTNYLTRNLNATGILECSSITAITLGSANNHEFVSGTITIYGR